ncbi:MAG TPA: PHP domain-containing protein, partial [Bacteroidia bacterium]
MFLNCHTYYSFKYGTLSPERLLKQAEFLDISRLAITDINNTSGCWETYRLAQNRGIEIAFGVDFRNGSDAKYILLAKDLDGFEEINRHLSEYAHSAKPFPDRAPQCPNTIVIYPFRKDYFFQLKENEFIGVSYTDLNLYLTSVWKNYPEKCVALLSVNFITRKDYQAHRLLRAMDLNSLLTHVDPHEFASHTQVFMPEHVAYEKFARFTYLVDNAKKLLAQCSVKLDFKEPKNKSTFSGNALLDIKMLLEKTEAGAVRRYGSIFPELKTR